MLSCCDEYNKNINTNERPQSARTKAAECLLVERQRLAIFLQLVGEDSEETQSGSAVDLYAEMHY